MTGTLVYKTPIKWSAKPHTCFAALALFCAIVAVSLARAATMLLLACLAFKASICCPRCPSLFMASFRSFSLADVSDWIFGLRKFVRLHIRNDTNSSNLNRSLMKLYLSQSVLSHANVIFCSLYSLFSSCLGFTSIIECLFHTVRCVLHSVCFIPEETKTFRTFILTTHLTVYNSTNILGISGFCKQLFCFAHIILGLVKNSINVGQTFDTIFDLVSQVSNLLGWGWNGQLKNLICHSLDAVRISSLFCNSNMQPVAEIKWPKY